MELPLVKKARRLVGAIPAKWDDSRSKSKLWMRFNRSTTEDRQKLTDNEVKQHATTASAHNLELDSTSPVEEGRCSQFDADFTRIKFEPVPPETARGVSTAESFERENWSGRLSCAAIRDACDKPVTSTERRKSGPETFGVDEQKTAPCAERCRTSVDGVTSCSSSSSRDVIDRTADCDVIKLDVVDRESTDDEIPSSEGPLHGTGRSAPCCEQNIGRGSTNRGEESTKRRSRKRKAKRFAKRTGLTLWRGVRFGAKIIYNGLVMMAATTNLNFNMSDGAAKAWKHWTAGNDERRY